MLGSPSLAQTAPAQQTSPTQQPEAASQPSTPSPAPAADTPSTEAAAASAGAVTAVAFGPGAKLFIEPMDGFGQLVYDSITKKKLPVVLVNEREKADFVMSGEAHVKKPGWFKGWVTTDSGKGHVAITDAHTGNQVFFYRFTRVDSMTTESQLYANWAGGCANHLKKTLKEIEKK
jgi:hypothetical protein